MLKKMKREEQFNFRYDMVHLASKNGIKPVAREFQTSASIVRKWVNRYRLEGVKGLKELSRKPHFSPNQCDSEFEALVIQIRQQTKCKYGAKRLKERFELKYSKNCIQRIINQNNLKRKRKTKTEKRNNLWAVKKLTKLFEKIQIDVKILTDIPLYWNQYFKEKLPKYEFTARDVKTGATFVCYANKNDSIASATFAAYILSHLKENGFDVQNILIQTDNGAEFNNCGRMHQNDTPFECMIKQVFKAQLGHIPPASPTFNSDVETFHRLVEDEFYAVEFILDKQDLLRKMYTYLIDFNYLRKNSYKDNKTPFQLAKEDDSNIRISVFNLPPVFLEDYFYLYLDSMKSLNTPQTLFKASKRTPLNPVSLIKSQQAYDSQADPFLISQISSLGGNNVPGIDNFNEISLFLIR